MGKRVGSVALLVVVAAACGGQSQTAAVDLWTKRADHAFDSGHFTSSGFGPKLVLLRTPDGMIAVEPATGRELWKSDDWLLHPKWKTAPLYKVSVRTREAEPLLGIEQTREVDGVVRLDPSTGKELARVSFAEPVLENERGTTLRLAGDRVIYITRDWSRGRMGAISLADGKRLWERPYQQGEFFDVPLVLPDRVLFGDPLSAYALSDGRELFKHDRRDDLHVSPDGAHIYVGGPGSTSVERVGPDGKLERVRAGPPVAVSNRYLVIDADGALEVYEHGKDKPVLSVPGAQLSATSVFGDYLFYFDGDDDHVYRHNIKTNARQSVTKVYGKTLLFSEAKGSAGAIITTPPYYATPYVFVHDWMVSAYEMRPH